MYYMNIFKILQNDIILFKKRKKDEFSARILFFSKHKYEVRGRDRTEGCLFALQADRTKQCA